MRHMDADLVGTPCVDTHCQQRHGGIWAGPEPPPLGMGGLATARLLQYGHFYFGCRVSPDTFAALSLFGCKAADKGKIFLPDLAVGKSPT